MDECNCEQVKALRAALEAEREAHRYTQRRLESELLAEQKVVEAATQLGESMRRWPGGQSVSINELTRVLAAVDALLLLRSSTTSTVDSNLKE